MALDCVLRQVSASSDAVTAMGGDGFAVVLDFEFLSRPAPPCKQ
jgi:hypothetical protein